MDKHSGIALPPPASTAALRVIWWTLFVINIVLVVFVRVRLLPFPLERDEGEYAYAGQLILRGIPPYVLAYNLKFPGSYYAYAGFMKLFGENISAIHLGLLITNLLTIVLVLLLARRLFDEITGLAAATMFGLLALSPSVAGYAAHATHFVTVFAIAGALCVYRALLHESRGWLFGGGLCLGLAVVMKQPGVWFAVVVGVYLIFDQFRRRLPLARLLTNAAIYAIAVAIPLGATALLLWRAGAFGKFWFWTIEYARTHGGLLTMRDAPDVLRVMLPVVIGDNWPLWVLALVGFAASVPRLVRKPALVFSTAISVAAMLAVTTGFFFREHYFVMLLPFLSIFAAFAVTRTFGGSLAWKIASVGIFILAVGWPVWRGERLFFRVDPITACRALYFPNPFVESLRIAQLVRERTGPEDQIAILGSEPQICFYAQRRSATGYIHTYGLMEVQSYAARMQHEMISEIERARPKIIVFVAVAESWLQQPGADLTIFKWADAYCRDNYVPVGVVRLAEEGTTYDFGASPSLDGLTANYIVIYQRRF